MTQQVATQERPVDETALIDVEATWHWTCRICPPVDGIVPGAYGVEDTRADAAAAARQHCRDARHDVNLRAIK